MANDIRKGARFYFFRACARAFTGFPRVDEDVVIEALAVIEKLPDRHRVQQVMHGVPWQHEIWQVVSFKHSMLLLVFICMACSSLLLYLLPVLFC